MGEEIAKYYNFIMCLFLIFLLIFVVIVVGFC